MNFYVYTEKGDGGYSLAGGPYDSYDEAFKQLQATGVKGIVSSEEDMLRLSQLQAQQQTPSTQDYEEEPVSPSQQPVRPDYAPTPVSRPGYPQRTPPASARFQRPPPRQPARQPMRKQSFQQPKRLYRPPMFKPRILKRRR